MNAEVVAWQRCWKALEKLGKIWHKNANAMDYLADRCHELKDSCHATAEAYHQQRRLDGNG